MKWGKKNPLMCFWVILVILHTLRQHGLIIGKSAAVEMFVSSDTTAS